VVGTEHLFDEKRQGCQRPIQPFAPTPEFLRDSLDQPLTRNQLAEGPLHVLCKARSKPAHLPGEPSFLANIHGG